MSPKLLIFLFLNGFCYSAWSQASIFRYEGEITGPTITSGTMSNQSFTVSLRHPSCAAASGLGVTAWTNNSISITDGKFLLLPQFSASELAQALNPNNDFGAGCPLTSDREFVISWNGETFYVPLADAPRASFAYTLGGRSSSGFLKIDPASSYSPLTATQVTTMLDIIGGTSPNYLGPSTFFSGDVSGDFDSLLVDKIKGISISSTSPLSGQVLKYNGSEWTPDTDSVTTTDASYAAKGLVQLNTDQATSGLYISSGVLALPNLVVAGTVGSTTQIPVLSYDSKGRITTVSSATLSTVTQVTSANSYLTINNPTSTPEIVANVGSSTNTLAAGNDARIVNALQQAAYASDHTNVTTCGGSSKPYWSTVSDAWECELITGFVTTELDPTVQAWAKNPPDAAFSTGSSLTLSKRVPTAAAAPTSTENGKVLKWNNSSSAWEWHTPAAPSPWLINSTDIYYSSGDVGVGTNTPRTMLDVRGAILPAASIANGSTTIDFMSGNLQHTTLSCQLFNLHNLQDGGTYTFIVKGGTAGDCSFSAFRDAGSTTLTVHTPGTMSSIAAKHTIFNFLVSGDDVYVTFMNGL